MQISRLTLTNFRGLTNHVLDFSPGFNLIVGINGAGKTAVLDALRILLAHALPELVVGISRFPGLGLTKGDITVERGQAYIQADFSRREQTYSLALSEQRYTTRDAVDSDKGLRDIRDVDAIPRLRHGERLERGDPRLEGTLRGQTSTRPEIPGALEPRPNKFVKQQRPQPLVLFFSVRRSIPNNKVSRGNPKAPAYLGIFDVERGLELAKLTDWWRGREELANEAPASRSARQLSAVIEALGHLLPHLSDWRIEDDVLTVIKVVEMEHLNINGEGIVEEEPRRLPVSILSDGERSLIALGADIAHRLVLLNEDSENPLGEGEGVVLIDELDLHLHPKWQRTVVESLRGAFPKLQFICTTHSLFLIQSQRMGNLIRLDHQGDEEEPAEHYHQKSIEDIAEEVQGVDIPQKSKRYLDMMAAAEEYYGLLRQVDAESQHANELAELKRKLDTLVTPFSDDPAFQALLKQERMRVIGAEE